MQKKSLLYHEIVFWTLRKSDGLSEILSSVIFVIFLNGNFIFVYFNGQTVLLFDCSIGRVEGN